jgi:hypothetical protein
VLFVVVGFCVFGCAGVCWLVLLGVVGFLFVFLPGRGHAQTSNGG